MTAQQPVPARAEPLARLPAGAASVSEAVLDGQVRTVLERPLFSPSRRPGAAVVASTVLPRLAGVIIGPRGARAIFASAGEDRAIVAGPGMHAGPYLIRGVGAGGVSVIGPNGPELLHPVYDHDATHGGGGLPAGAPTGPSILDLLRAHVQNGGGMRSVQLPSPLLHKMPGLQR